MPLNAPFWGNVQKMTFRTDAGAYVVLQNNPDVYNLVPFSHVQAAAPAQMGPLILNGPVEYPPQAIVLSWSQMSKADFDQLAQYVNLQTAVMIDMNDQGWYGILKLGKFEYMAGAIQKVGKVEAIFMCTQPANGKNSVISSLSTPATPTQTLGTGGSITSGTVTWYALTFCSVWGETTPCPAFSSTATANGTSNTIAWTAPSSVYYRKARLYASSIQAGVAAGATAYLMAEVLSPFSQQWIDVTGINGLANQATIPLANTAFTGFWSGGEWQNGV